MAEIKFAIEGDSAIEATEDLLEIAGIEGFQQLDVDKLLCQCST